MPQMILRRNWLPAIVLSGLVPVAGIGAPSTWLGLCDGFVEDGVLAQRYTDPSGHTQTLRLDQGRVDGCYQVELAAELSDVRWIGLVPPDTARRLAGGVGLVGQFDEPQVAVSEVVPKQATPAEPESAAESGKRVAADTHNRPLRDQSRSTWLWQVEVVLQDLDRQIDQLAADDIRTLFLAIPIAGEPVAVSRSAELGEAIGRLRAVGIEVWAVEGDPAAVTLSGRVPFVARTQALVRFNSAQPPNQRLAGIQYDIEPYLNPHFALDKGVWLQAYVDTVAQLAAAADMPVELAVPFWWPMLAVDGKPLLDLLADLVDGLAIMNYRTDPDEIRRLAEPFLSWGAAHDRYVRVGLEAGPLPDQEMVSFRVGRPGRLWHVLVGDADAIVLLDKALENPAGASLQERFSVPVPAANTTFFGQRDRLDALLPELDRAWQSKPAFAGIALHEYVD